MFINENRFFSMIENFFENTSNVLHEIIQNSCRAGADKLDISFKNQELIAIDNGIGCHSWQSIFILAGSGWNKEIQDNQQPAGFGMYHLLAISTSVYIKSLFGSIEIDTETFFKEKSYRENIENLVNKNNTDKHFYLKAKLKEKAVFDIQYTLFDKAAIQFGWYDIDIKINNIPITKNTPTSFLNKKNNLISTIYKDNEVLINIPHFNTVRNFEIIHYLIDFYGQPIYSGFSENSIQVYYKIRNGLPIIPVLPYRNSIKRDEAFSLFQNFIENTILQHCIDKINNTSTLSKSELISYMKIVEKLGSNSDLDSLNKFYYKRFQPYFQENYWSDNDFEELIYTIEDTIVFSKLNLKINNNDIEKEYDLDKLSLENGVYWEIEAKPFPAWTRTENRSFDLDITIIEEVYDGEFIWYKCVCNNKNIKLLTLFDYTYSGKVYFMDSPEIIFDYEEPILSKIYTEDNDYHYSKVEFVNSLKTDIQNISKVYSRFDIFHSLSRIQGMDIYKLNRLVFENNQISFILDSGIETTISLK